MRPVGNGIRLSTARHAARHQGRRASVHGRLSVRSDWVTMATRLHVKKSRISLQVLMISSLFHFFMPSVITQRVDRDQAVVLGHLLAQYESVGYSLSSSIIRNQLENRRSIYTRRALVLAQLIGTAVDLWLIPSYSQHLPIKPASPTPGSLLQTSGTHFLSCLFLIHSVCVCVCVCILI